MLLRWSRREVGRSPRRIRDGVFTSLLCLYLDKFVIMFIDDILVYFKNEEEYVENLTTVLRFLREHKMYAKLNKCSFFQTEVHYLGNVVSK